MSKLSAGRTGGADVDSLKVNQLRLKEERSRASPQIGSELKVNQSASSMVDERPSILKKMASQCERFCSNSSIHGMKYLVDSQLSWSER